MVVSETTGFGFNTGRHGIFDFIEQFVNSHNFNYCHKVINCLSCIITVIISQIKLCRFFHVVKGIWFCLLCWFNFCEFRVRFNCCCSTTLVGFHLFALKATEPWPRSHNIRLYPSWCVRSKRLKCANMYQFMFINLYRSSHDGGRESTDSLTRLMIFASLGNHMNHRWLTLSSCPGKKTPDFLGFPSPRGGSPTIQQLRTLFFLPRVVSSHFLCLDLFGAALLAIQILLEKRRVLRDCWRGYQTIWSSPNTGIYDNISYTYCSNIKYRGRESERERERDRSLRESQTKNHYNAKNMRLWVTVVFGFVCGNLYSETFLCKAVGGDAATLNFRHVCINAI